MKTRFFIGIFILGIVVVLSGCFLNQNNTRTITLYDGEEVFDVMDDVNYADTITLPTINKDGYMFVGWTDDLSVYFDEFMVDTDISLYAVFEDNEEVFSYVTNEEDQEAIIQGYTGEGLYITIPQYLGGNVVTVIGSLAFEGSNLIEVFVPIDVTIGLNAFKDAASLEVVQFYGEHILPYEAVLSSSEYDDIISENEATCSIETGSIESGAYTFTEGCPIFEVIEVNEIVVNDVTYRNYQVSMDMNLIDEPNHYNFSIYAFFGAVSLHTVEIPNGNTLIQPDTFTGCPSLTNFIVDEDHPYIKNIDGVLYSKDETQILLYPEGLTASSFVIPDSVVSVSPAAFTSNLHLQELYISEYLTGNLYLRGLQGLEEIVVAQANPTYFSVDGVLYHNGLGDDVDLISYPASKTGTSFIVPSNVTSLETNAFDYNKYLETIEMNDGLYRLWDQVFRNAESLTTIEIPASVEIIGRFIILDSTIETIIVHRSIEVDGTISTLVGPFVNSEHDLAIYVSDDSFDDYKYAMNWSNYQDQLHLLSDYNE